MQHWPRRTVFIGDIHGCFHELMELLSALKYRPGHDRLVSLGDLIHKGPHSAKVIEYFYEQKLEVLMGNHEWHLLEVLRGNCKTYPEGEKILSELTISKKKLKQWLASLPFYIRDKDFIAVHGALDPAKNKYKKTDPMDMISARYFNEKTQQMIGNIKKPPEHIKPWYEVYPADKIKDRYVLFGHWAKPQIRQYGKFYCLDSGCCYGGKLSAFTLPDGNIYQVNSQQKRQFNY